LRNSVVRVGNDFIVRPIGFETKKSMIYDVVNEMRDLKVDDSSFLGMHEYAFKIALLTNQVRMIVAQPIPKKSVPLAYIS